jgi:hypothetical protein
VTGGARGTYGVENKRIQMKTVKSKGVPIQGMRRIWGCRRIALLILDFGARLK